MKIVLTIIIVVLCGMIGNELFAQSAESQSKSNNQTTKTINPKNRENREKTIDQILEEQRINRIKEQNNHIKEQNMKAYNEWKSKPTISWITYWIFITCVFLISRIKLRYSDYPIEMSLYITSMTVFVTLFIQLKTSF